MIQIPTSTFILLALLVVPATGKTIKVPLWPDKAAPFGEGRTEKANPVMTAYIPRNSNGTAVVICPGGGYGTLVKGPEGTGIARWLNKHKITGIVLEYRLPKGEAFRPLLDAQRAIRLTRANAKDWNIDPGKVGIMGFSAGGHLASTAATHFDKGEKGAKDPVNRESSRPDFAVLIYPVITMGNGTHLGSRKNLLGPKPTAEAIEMFSNEKQVTQDTPPCFVAHAANDAVVHVSHSRMFQKALVAKGVKSKYYEPPTGNHGFNIYKGEIWDSWQKQSLDWLRSLDLIK